MSNDERIRGIDVVRGAVMVLMALDHVRVYSGVPAGGAEPAVFFTRWVTHFCAPAFAFLAGTSAFLYGRSVTRTALCRFLLTRGLMLIALELTVIKAAWTFRLDYSEFVLFGVIWMLGACMVAMAALVRLSAAAVGATGLAIVACQQLFGRVRAGWAWELVYPSGIETPEPLVVLYSVLPWLGVMAAGYGFGALVAGGGEGLRRWSLRLGLAATATFVVGAAWTTALASQSELPPLLAALNQSKYPPSQLFLLMTLGPTLVLLPGADRARGAVGRALETFGRVPMFFYLVHIPLIHLAATAVVRVREGGFHPERYANAPYVWMPPEQRWDLGLLYLVFAAVVALLYLLCRRFADFKARRRSAWLRYL